MRGLFADVLPTPISNGIGGVVARVKGGQAGPRAAQKVTATLPIKERRYNPDRPKGPKNSEFSARARKAGMTRSEAKAAAARENGRLSFGRPPRKLAVVNSKGQAITGSFIRVRIGDSVRDYEIREDGQIVPRNEANHGQA